jgi:hypothetical protein
MAIEHTPMRASISKKNTEQIVHDGSARRGPDWEE